MREEHVARRPQLIAGIVVRLADRQEWWLPTADALRGDSEFEALLRAIDESEDCSEMMLGELAVTIFLLRRNYALGAADLEALLSFGGDRPDREALQRAVHELAVEGITRSQARKFSAAGEVSATGSGWGSTLVRWFRAVWPLWSS
jgi:hypothetical protein